VKLLRKSALVLMLLLIAATTNVTATINIPKAKAAAPTLAISSLYNATKAGVTFTANITVSNVVEMYGWVVSLEWDPDAIEINKGDKAGLYKRRVYYNVYESDFMRNVSSTNFLANAINEEDGTITALACLFVLAGTSVSGSGVLGSISFNLSKVGTTTINITQSGILDRTGGAIDHIVVNGIVTDLPPPLPPPIWMQPWFSMTVIAVAVLVAVPVFTVRALRRRVPLTKEELEKIEGYKEEVEGIPLLEDSE
jgi:hypothetical protein